VAHERSRRFGNSGLEAAGEMEGIVNHVGSAVPQNPPRFSRSDEALNRCAVDWGGKTCDHLTVA